MVGASRGRERRVATARAAELGVVSPIQPDAADELLLYATTAK